jgi:hypothetical protein
MIQNTQGRVFRGFREYDTLVEVAHSSAGL